MAKKRRSYQRKEGIKAKSKEGLGKTNLSGANRRGRATTHNNAF